MHDDTATPHSPSTPGSNAFLTIQDVQRLTSLSRATIYRMGSSFPAPIKLTPSGRRICFSEAEVRLWMSNRLAVRKVAGASTHERGQLTRDARRSCRNLAARA